MADENTVKKPAAEEVGSAEHTRCGCYFRPNVDILEKADELVVLADVPGAAGNKIDVDFEDGILSIHAHVEPPANRPSEYFIHEYGVGDYHRTFHVSEAIDAERITAECTDGVLVLRLPKAAAATPRRIAVKTE
jgi:HSP20 family protein